jgi:hypothetical protein
MNDAPEKIWAEAGFDYNSTGKNGEWTRARTDGGTQYTRTDLADAFRADQIRWAQRRANTVSELEARIDRLEAELHTMKTSGVIEVAVRNPSVSEYMAHWEGRAEKAEARVAALEAKP